MLVEVLAVACGIALFAARAAPPTLTAMSTLPALRARLALAPRTKIFTGKALEATHGALSGMPLMTDTDPTARPVPASAAAFAYTWTKPLFISLVASAPLVKLLLGSPVGTTTANGATYLVTDEGVFWVRRIRVGDIAWLEAAVSQHPAAMVNFSWA